MWFCTCSCALGPRWRGHSHDLVTGPDSRVASHVGGMVEIPGEMARRPLPLHPFSRPPHPFSHGREGHGCCDVRGP